MAACLKNNRAAAAAAASTSLQEIFKARFEKKSDARDEVIAQSAEKRVINVILQSREWRKSLFENVTNVSLAQFWRQEVCRCFMAAAAPSGVSGRTPASVYCCRHN